MSGEDEDKPARDLTAGVGVDEVAEGAMLAGQVEGEPVILARTGGRLYALAARCTHHGAPLEDGVIVDGQVRCPWHHARFDLQTGEAVAAPAFQPLACFNVEEREGRAFVSRGRPAPERRQIGGDGPRVVILGGGAGGYACAEMLARKGFKGQVSLVSDDADPPYDRTDCSKAYLKGEKTRDELILQAKGVYDGGGVALRKGVRAEAIDLTARQVRLAGGETLAYDILVLAMGAEPRRPDIPGFDRPEVHLLRTLRDADALIAAAEKAERAAVVGASFIGLEAAAALIARGLQVDVVAPETIPLAKVLGEEVGRYVQGLHAGKGVRFHLGRKVERFDGAQLSLDDGSTIDAGVVVCGVGVTPRSQLAEAAGLKIDKGGVVVDARLQASSPGVYAIGDLALYPDAHAGSAIRVEHWVHAERQGQYVARRLLGAEGAYDDLPFFWSAHYDATIGYIGHAEDASNAQIDGQAKAGDFLARYRQDGQVRAEAAASRDAALLDDEAAMEAGRAPG